jgi:hypothetical protein
MSRLLFGGLLAAEADDFFGLGDDRHAVGTGRAVAQVAVSDGDVGVRLQTVGAALVGAEPGRGSAVGHAFSGASDVPSYDGREIEHGDEHEHEREHVSYLVSEDGGGAHWAR